MLLDTIEHLMLIDSVLNEPVAIAAQIPPFFTIQANSAPSTDEAACNGALFHVPSSQPGSLLGGDRPNICFAWHYCGQALTGEPGSA